MKIAMIILAIAASALAMLAIVYFFVRTQPGPWMLVKNQIVSGKFDAALEISLEPYTVSLKGQNSEDDRFQVRLKISDPAMRQPDRLVIIPQHLQVSDLPFDARLLGDDGRRIWFFVKEIGAWDYVAKKLVTPDDLTRANPTLGKFGRKDNSHNPLIANAARTPKVAPQYLWQGESRLFTFRGKLHIGTPDYQSGFVIDQRTLHAIPD